MIVLYSHCKVNWGTNLSVVLYYVILILASTARLGLLCGAFPTYGVRPHYAAVHSVSDGASDLTELVSWRRPKDARPL